MKINHGIFQLSSTPIGNDRWGVAVCRSDHKKLCYQADEEREVVIRLDAKSDDEAIQKVRNQIDSGEIT